MRTRTRGLAERIVEKNFSDSFIHLRPDQINQLVDLFIDYSPLYCETCHNTGRLIRIAIHSRGPSELVTEDCQCYKFRRVNDDLQTSIKLSGIPIRYYDANVDDWNSPATNDAEKAMNDKSISIIDSYTKKFDGMLSKGYGLFLCGPNGVGKTYLACAIAIKAIRKKYRVRYYTMSKIVRTVVDGWYDDNSKVVVNDIEKSDFLVIDDMDKVYQTKTKLEVSVLDNLFRERLQNNRPMIVTSNRTLDQVKEAYGGSIHSMFSEHCALCPLVGDDYRKKIANNMEQDILNS